MKTLTINFDKAYPAFSPVSFTGSCKVEEPENAVKEAFRELTLTGFDGYSFPHDFVAHTVSFAKKAQKNLIKPGNHCDVMRLNCDKIVLFELHGQKYMLFCELKSTFSSDEIGHAKDQIVGSVVKIRSLFHSLQEVNLDEYKPIGLIVSFQPTDEQINALSKNYDMKTAFAVRLNTDRKYHMPEEKTNKYFHPLNVGTIDLYYLPVPGRQKTYSVDINTIINKIGFVSPMTDD